MDPARYANRLEEATDEEVANEHINQYSAAERFLVKDIIAGRVVWYNSFVKDLWLYYENNHVLLSIFRAHRLHPFSRRERLVVLICGLFMTFFVSASVLDSTVIAQSSLQTDNPADNVDLAERTRAEFDRLERNSNSLASALGFIVLLYNIAMKQAAACTCVQGSKQWILKLAERAGHFFMWFAAGISGLLAFLGASAVASAADTTRDNDPEFRVKVVDFVRAFFITQASSWAYGFALGFVLFAISYARDHRRFDSETLAVDSISRVQYHSGGGAGGSAKARAAQQARGLYHDNGAGHAPSAGPAGGGYNMQGIGMAQQQPPQQEQRQQQALPSLQSPQVALR